MNYSELIKKDKSIKKALRSANALTKKTIRLAKLPHKIIPASNDHFLELFYWDSFFIMQGLDTKGIQAKRRIRKVVENFFVLLDRLGHIPNSYPTHITRSQPPFLSSMVRLVYKNDNDNKWLERAFHYVEKEYLQVWHKEPRLIENGLSRYFDPIHPEGKARNAEDESGWDFTPRFLEKCDQVCPIDLNALLYKYEKDLSWMAEVLNKKKESSYWKDASEKRKNIINKLMWDKAEGFYYDYQFTEQKKLHTKSLAAYMPMWVGMATKEQAKKLVSHLDWFEHEGGLAVTDKNYGIKEQWSCPNSWPPCMWYVINGLRNYDYHEDADRLTYKWLKLCAKSYMKTGQWHEKLQVTEKISRIDDKRYPHQTEQYWTAAVFLSLHNQMTKAK